MKPYFLFAAVLVIAFSATCSGIESPASRHADPVVLLGKDVPELNWYYPQDLVAFSYNALVGGWSQIPLQIDEKHFQLWDRIKNGVDCKLWGRDLWGEMYADPDTYSGPDENPMVDANDEIVFMARHLGGKKDPTVHSPPGIVQNGLEVELEIQDPALNDTSIGWVYIYQNDGSLSQDAGMPLVSYNLNLMKTDNEGSNNYFDAYVFNCQDGVHGGQYECRDGEDTGERMNPEDTWFRSEHYERHWKHNWLSDQIKIKTDGATGENFLDAQDFQFVLKNCGRCVDSFMRGKTGFVTNKVGPVRAIRSYIGANSGTITQREHHLYEQREDQTTFIRVHTIPGIFDYHNYLEGTDLTYYNCHNMKGIQVDGNNDAIFNDNYCRYEMITGDTGTYLRTIDLNHNYFDLFHYVNLAPENFMRHWYYDNDDLRCEECGDEDTPVMKNGWHLCSYLLNGQKSAWGTHGIRNDENMQIFYNTDEMRHKFYDLPEDACDIEVVEPWLFTMNLTYHHYFLPPGVDPRDMESYYEGSTQDLKRKPVEYCHSCPGNYPLEVAKEEAKLEPAEVKEDLKMVIPEMRRFDPVVLFGVNVTELYWRMPQDLVGFRYTSDYGWEQFPIQIDEKHLQDWDRIKNSVDCHLIKHKAYAEMWADMGTFSGPDENPYFDADDELVFMARHLGQKNTDLSSSTLPRGVKDELQLELEITDPLDDSSTIGFAYIFLQDGSLRQDAGIPLVSYDFQLTKYGANSDYFDHYEFDCLHGAHGGDYQCRDITPKNPEDSWFMSKYYNRHFAENWYSDAVNIFAGGATGENFWNAQEFQILPKTCGRCVDTFRNGKTGFIINKSGPVRAIRSWVGANSGTITQRESILYEQREDQNTFLRVHTMPGLMDYNNYKQEVPLKYFNCNNRNGITINGDMGVEDNNFNHDLCDWEAVQGETGTYLRTLELHNNAFDYAGVYDLDASVTMRHWFYDDAEPKILTSEDGATLFDEMLLCTTLLNNQLAAWGTSGITTHFARNNSLVGAFEDTGVQIILNTDPLRHRFYDPEIYDEDNGGACDIEIVEPWLWAVNVSWHQYYLAPDAPVVQLGPGLAETSVAMLERKPVPYCYSCPGNYPLGNAGNPGFTTTAATSTATTSATNITATTETIDFSNSNRVAASLMITMTFTLILASMAS